MEPLPPSSDAVEVCDRRYRLRLYVTGMTPRSTRAIENVRSICQRFLEDQYELEVIDIYQQPCAARTEQLVAAPTLIKHAPPPERRLIGDMSSERRVLAGLDIRAARTA